MIAMIFEFWFDSNAPEIYEEYLETATELRTHLADLDGFGGVERFESTSEPGKFVAIGFFENEDAVSAWRNRPEHRHVQTLGRNRLFTNYRLRMAEVVRDYGPDERGQAPADSRTVHDSDDPS